MIAQFVEAPELVQKNTVVPLEIIDQCAVQGVHLQIPAANRENAKSGTPFIVQSPWWKKAVDMFFGMLWL